MFTVVNIGKTRASCGGKEIFPGQAAIVPDWGRGAALAHPNLAIAGEEKPAAAPKEKAAGKGPGKTAELALILKHKVAEIIDIAERMTAAEIRDLIALEENAEKEKLFGLLGGPRKGLIKDLATLAEMKEEEAAP